MLCTRPRYECVGVGSNPGTCACIRVWVGSSPGREVWVGFNPGTGCGIVGVECGVWVLSYGGRYNSHSV